jgi:8-oxo-dGTP diphosphatase
METRLFVATKALIEHDGKVLIIRESSGYKDGTNAAKFDVPGGRLTPGEHYLDALHREIKEETGLVVDTLTPFVVRSGVKISPSAGKVLIYFVIFRTHIRGIKPTVTLSKEHVEYKWIQKKEAMKEDFGNVGGEYKEILGEI